jgi:hypothetical protein
MTFTIFPNDRVGAGVVTVTHWLEENRPYLKEYLKYTSAAAEEKGGIIYVKVAVNCSDRYEYFSFEVKLEPMEVILVDEHK